jgi:hypothetical protein
MFKRFATRARSRTKALIAFCLATRSGSLRIDDGCTVAIMQGASGD